ncbi:MAG: biotin synthase BioB, partial [Nitrosomonas sp.]|nr:biotin synthase BioB [Nitrosomonas sp.]
MKTSTNPTTENHSGRPEQLHPHAMQSPSPIKWHIADIQKLLDLPFADLLFQAQTVHRQHHDAN